MFDFLWGFSYIKLKSGNKLYLEQSYYDLNNMMKDSNSTITVDVVDWTGIFSDRRVINKGDIVDYGSN